MEENVCAEVGGCGQGRAHGEPSDGCVRGGAPTVMGCPGNWLGWICSSVDSCSYLRRGHSNRGPIDIGRKWRGRGKANVGGTPGCLELRGCNIGEGGRECGGVGGNETGRRDFTAIQSTEDEGARLQHRRDRDVEAVWSLEPLRTIAGGRVTWTHSRVAECIQPGAEWLALGDEVSVCRFAPSRSIV